MPHGMVLILVCLALCSWFLIVERQNFIEKVFIIIGIIVVYATYRVLTGVPTDQIFTPIIIFFNT